MRSPLSRRGARATTSLDTAAPPHAERLNAAKIPNERGAGRRRATRLAAIVVGVVAVGAACQFPSNAFQNVGSPDSGSGSPAPAQAAAVVAPAPGTPPVEHWYALAQCETNGNWARRARPSSAASACGARTGLPTAGCSTTPAANLATPEQQIAVAANLWLAGGSWGCKIGDGWDHR